MEKAKAKKKWGREYYLEEQNQCFLEIARLYEPLVHYVYSACLAKFDWHVGQCRLGGKTLPVQFAMILLLPSVFFFQQPPNGEGFLLRDEFQFRRHSSEDMGWRTGPDLPHSGHPRPRHSFAAACLCP